MARGDQRFGGMASDQGSYDRETDRYAELNGKYKHYCPEWDFMAIDETCPEWDACLCFGKPTSSDPLALEA